MIAIALSKQQTLDADPKAIQQINFTANLDREGNIAIFFIIEEANKKPFKFLTRNCVSIANLIYFNIISV